MSAPSRFQFVHCLLGCVVFLFATSGVVEAADLVEFLSGAKVEGTVTDIRREDKEFDIQVKLGGRTLTRTYSFTKVHAVTLRGKRYVLTPMGQGSGGGSTSDADSSGATRSRGEVKQFIETVGATPPDWYEQTPLDYPKSLDLSWPLKPEGKWNNQKNMGQYIWDIINPNPRRWKSGIRLLHHIVSTHKDDRTLLVRDMKALGSMYFRLFQDYPRAAFWLQKAGVGKGQPESVVLAECYWRLGNKGMAMETLASRRLPLGAIKLFGDMGETQRAIQLANAFRKSQQPHEALLLAGDACRHADRTQQAIDFYEEVLDLPDARNEDYTKRYRARARESINAIRLFEQADVQRVSDGSYQGKSTGYNGPLEVSVTVKDHKIQDVTVTDHREKQFYSALTDTTGQIMAKQSVQGIDATSRATITSQAIVNAAAQALSQGAK